MIIYPPRYCNLTKFLIKSCGLRSYIAALFCRAEIIGFFFNSEECEDQIYRILQYLEKENSHKTRFKYTKSKTTKGIIHYRSDHE